MENLHLEFWKVCQKPVQGFERHSVGEHKA